MNLYDISTKGYGTNREAVQTKLNEYGKDKLLARLRNVPASAFVHEVRHTNVPEPDMHVLYEVFGDLLQIEFAGILSTPMQEVSSEIGRAIEGFAQARSDLSKLLQSFATINNLTVISSNDISAFTQVQVEENACTERIDGLLQEGWRIVHVWKDYQNHRRPSYIMGKKS